MRITLKLFASLREALGVSEEVIQVPTSVRTVGDLKNWLGQRDELWRAMLAEGRAVRSALNQVMVDDHQALVEDAELAFFPPVTGG